MRNRIINGMFRMLQWMRVSFYDALSTGDSKGCAKKYQPVLILGNGIVEFENNVKLGYFPSPFFLSGYIHLEARGSAASIKFGEDSNVKIMKGVVIGVGSVIANGSIVVGEIPPSVIAGGNPARVLKAIEG